MLDTKHAHLVSAAALALALSPGGFPGSTHAAEADPAAPVEASAAAPAPEAATSQDQTAATPSTPAEQARAAADERRSAMLAERQQRYEELRASAAELGVELPASPPWESSPRAMPKRPERMTPMSPEERQAMREEHWKQMRADAAERGIEMPETPPWVEAEQRHAKMQERFEKYREVVKAMTEEQREAARALFSRPPMRPAQQRPRMPDCDRGCGHAPWGYGGYGAYPGAEPQGMAYPYPPMMQYPNAPGYDQGPPPPAPEY